MIIFKGLSTMHFGHRNMGNGLILSVLRHLFQCKCTINDIRKMNTDFLQNIIDDILYLTDTSIETIMRGINAQNDNTVTKLFNVLKYIQTTFMHHPENIGHSVYMHLNNRLTDIIKKSTIEHDISIAYLIKRVIKEILINSTSYTWKDKLEAFYYICGHMRYLEAAAVRSNRFKRQSVDLISSLNHVKQLTEQKTLMEVIRDSIY